MVDREIPAVPTPPFSDELLADLHAGNLDPEFAARLWPVVLADPESKAMIDSLDEVVSVLGSRGRDLDAGAEMPEWLRSTLDSAVAGPTKKVSRWSSPSTVIGLSVAASIAIVIGVVAVGTGSSSPDPTPAQASGSSHDIDGSMVAAAVGRFDSGRLNDPQLLRECLAANGIDAAATVLGTSSVTIDGRRATLVIVPGPAAPTLTALAVGDSCGTGSPDTVSRADVG